MAELPAGTFEDWALPTEDDFGEPPSLAFSADYFGVQGIELPLPQGPVLGQPFIDLGQRLGPKAVDPPLRFLANLDKPCLSQHPQMP